MRWSQTVIANVLGCVAAAPAVADTTDLEDASPQTVTITANRREERLQELPAAATVVTARHLVQQDIKTLDALPRAVPALGSTLRALSVRGIGGAAPALSAEGSVGVLLDGVSLAGSAEFPPGLFDVERIEVLEGPQGTMFGLNATAGVVNVVTRAPTTTALFAEGAADVRSRRGGSLEGAVNVPVEDRFALRVAASIVQEPRDVHNRGTQCGAERGPADAVEGDARRDRQPDRRRLDRPPGRRPPWRIYASTPGSPLTRALAACGVESRPRQRRGLRQPEQPPHHPRVRDVGPGRLGDRNVHADLGDGGAPGRRPDQGRRPRLHAGRRPEPRADAGQGIPLVVEPETSTTFEAGLKSAFLDGRFAVNLTAYWSKLRDVQTTIWSPAAAGFIFANAPEASNRGVSLSVYGRPLPALTVNGGLAYVVSTYGPGFLVPCPQGSAPGCTRDASGEQIGGTPRLRAVLAVDHAFRWQARGGSIGFDVVGQSRRVFDTADPARDIAGSATVGARVGALGGRPLGRHALRAQPLRHVPAELPRRQSDRHAHRRRPLVRPVHRLREPAAGRRARGRAVLSAVSRGTARAAPAAAGAGS